MNPVDKPDLIAAVDHTVADDDGLPEQAAPSVHRTQGQALTPPRKRLLQRPIGWIAIAVMLAMAVFATIDALRPKSPHRLEADVQQGTPEPAAVVPLSEEPATTTPPSPALPAQPLGIAELPLVPDQSPVAPAESGPAPAPAASSIPAAAPEALPAAPAHPVQQIEAVMARLDALMAALQAKGYIKPGERIDTIAAESLQPYPAAVPQERRVEPPRAPARARPAATSPVPSPVPASTGPGAQLLAIDLWNGTPSVVVGTGVPGDNRLKMMQPGDVINGVALKHVDMAGQRATFTARGHDTVLQAGGGL